MPIPHSPIPYWTVEDYDFLKERKEQLAGLVDRFLKPTCLWHARLYEELILYSALRHRELSRRIKPRDAVEELDELESLLKRIHALMGPSVFNFLWYSLEPPAYIASYSDEFGVAEVDPSEVLLKPWNTPQLGDVDPTGDLFETWTVPSSQSLKDRPENGRAKISHLDLQFVYQCLPRLAQHTARLRDEVRQKRGRKERFDRPVIVLLAMIFESAHQSRIPHTPADADTGGLAGLFVRFLQAFLRLVTKDARAWPSSESIRHAIKGYHKELGNQAMQETREQMDRSCPICSLEL